MCLLDIKRERRGREEERKRENGDAVPLNLSLHNMKYID
jgi:hypothetical protein